MEAATDTINGAAAIIDLISATAVNHGEGDSQSAFSPQSSELAFGPCAKPTFLCPNIPTALGEVTGWGSGEPWGWSYIVNFLEGEVWPNGDPAKLKQAATAFETCATGFNSRQSLVDTAVTEFRSHTSPDLAVAADKIAEMKTQLTGVGDAMTSLAGLCRQYAQNIEDAHQKIKDELVELLAWTVGIEVVAAIGAIFTWGGSEGAGQFIEAGRVAVTASRVVRIIRALATAVESLGTVGPALMRGIAAGQTRMRAFIEAPILLATFEGDLAAAQRALTEALGETTSYARPTLRKSVKDIILGAAQRRVVGGKEYYVSATNKKVLMPVDGTYPESVTKLPVENNPRSGKPEYYVDAATGFKYPVDPKPQFGHTPGEEFWRLRDQAVTEGWSRQKFIDEFNNPELFQLEDAPGNYSHRYEMPRAH